MTLGCFRHSAWPTDNTKGERQICRVVAATRFVARTNELFQKGEAPRTTAVATLSRPQKREQATKSRPSDQIPTTGLLRFLQGIQLGLL